MADARRDERHIRPEKASTSGKNYYDEEEAERYSTTLQTQDIQHDLTQHALRLLHISSPVRSRVAIQ